MSNLNVAHTNDGVSTQLNLPTALGLVRPRRERTDADREWCSRQLAIPHEKRIDKLVFERMAFYGSLNPERTAYPSVKRLAREAMCSPRSAQYALRRLESAGLIECLDDASGRTSSRGGRTTSRYCVAGAQTVRPSRANAAPEVLKEGTKNKEKVLSLNDTAQTIDQSEGKEVSLPLFPSKEKAKATARAQGTKKTVFSFQDIVAKWFKLMRKLGRYCDDTMALAFDKLPHREKTVIINGLEAVEQEQVYLGKMDAPPLTRPKGFLTAEAEEGQRLAACAHVPADDLPINCGKCGAYIGKE